MPVSRHRKDHKKKVNKYKKDVQVARERLKEQMMREYMEKVQANQQTKRQENGELVTDDEINIDLDVDLGMDTPITETEIPVQEVTLIEEPIEPIESIDKPEESK